MLAACRQGLDVLDEHRLTLGASELRAQATVHGAELAALAQRHAAQAGRPRLLLTWSERWRATALAVPAVRPLADEKLNASLAALRAVTRKVDEDRTQGKQSTTLQREQQRLEREVRASSLRSQSAQSSGRTPFSPADLLDRLNAAQAAAAAKGSRDTLTATGTALFLHTPDGFGTSDLAQKLFRIIGTPSKQKKPAVAATARNWATATKLLALCEEK